MDKKYFRLLNKDFELPDVDQWIQEIDQKISDATSGIDLTNYATEVWVNQRLSEIVMDNIDLDDLVGIATEVWVNQKISEIPLPDLTNYDTKDEITQRLAELPQVLAGDGITILNDINGNKIINANSVELFQIVDSLPDTGLPNKIYLLNNLAQGNNKYLEYLWINNLWEAIGIIEVDLSNYPTIGTVNTLIQEKIEELPEILAGDGITITEDIMGNKIINANSVELFQIVTFLPDIGLTNKIYLLANLSAGNNRYLEYIWINNVWEAVGSISVDLSNYATKNEVDEKINNIDFESKINEILADADFAVKNGQNYIIDQSDVIVINDGTWQ
jgi:hypothetical protein